MMRFGVVAAAAVLATALYARDISPDTGVPVSVLVTVEGHGNTAAPKITSDNLLVSQNKQRRQITALEPLNGTNGLQLWVLIDDGSGANLGNQLADLKRFVMAQPASTQIGVGYLRNGFVSKAQE